MSASKTLTRSLSTLALAAVLAVGAAALVPAEAYGGSCFNFLYTANITGTSSVDCPWAIMDFHHKADARASNHCSTMGRAVCFQTDSNPQFCNQLYPPFTVNGTVSWKCSGIPTPF
ncbi:MAG: hypothetical protein AAF657_31315 [Acidobacteriota bacterium]